MVPKLICQPSLVPNLKFGAKVHRLVPKLLRWRNCSCRNCSCRTSMAPILFTSYESYSILNSTELYLSMVYTDSIIKSIWYSLDYVLKSYKYSISSQFRTLQRMASKTVHMSILLSNWQMSLQLFPSRCTECSYEARIHRPRPIENYY